MGRSSDGSRPIRVALVAAVGLGLVVLAGLWALGVATSGPELTLVKDHGTDRPGEGITLLEDPAAARDAWDEIDDPALPDGGAPARGREAGRYRHPDEVDLDALAVLRVEFGESGTCPHRLADVRWDAEAGVLRFSRDTGLRLGGCTDDFVPYTALIAVERERLPEPDELPAPARTDDGPFELRVEAGR